MQGDLYITGDPEADALLNTDPLAVLIGMLLDQQVPMEWAFASPLKLKERLGGTLDAATIAAMPLEELEVLFKGPPALHRFPGSMAKRTQQLCQHLVDDYGGRAEARVDRRGRRPGAVRPPARPARLRRREGQDLHGAAGQALRRPPGGLGGGGGDRSPTTPSARSPTSTRPSRSTRCAPSRS